MCEDELNRLEAAVLTATILVSLAAVSTGVAIALNGSVFGALLGWAAIAMAGAVAFIVSALVAMGLAIGYATDFERCVASQNTPCSGAFASARAELLAIEALLLVQLYGSLAALGVSWIPVIGVAPMVTVLIALSGIFVLLLAYRATWASYLDCVGQQFRGAGA
jgi:hypothetical protein